MGRHELSDEKWDRIAPLLPSERGRRGRPPKSNRKMVNAMLWVLRTGAPWRDVPPHVGPWGSVYTRFRRWQLTGVWERVFQELGKDADRESFMLDATIVRAHQDATGAEKNNGEQAIGRSRGGPSTKIHVNVDALGNPVRLILTQGQKHDITQAPALIADLLDANIIADRAYDSAALVEQIESQNCVAVIPARKCCSPREIDSHLYKERALVECFFQKIKRNRRIAMRFEKLAARFLAMVMIAAIVVLLA